MTDRQHELRAISDESATVSTTPAPVAQRITPPREQLDPQRMEGELRPAAASGRERPEGNLIPPEHQPGTVGHTQARNQQPHDMTPAEEIHEGAHTGSSRSVHIHQPIRKIRSA